MRDLHANTISQLSADTVRPRFFFEVELDDDSTLNYWTGEKDISYSGKTWQANGFFNDPGQIGESKDGFGGLEIDLAGEPSALISVILGSIQRNRPGRLLFGFVDDSNNVIANPTEWKGKLDSAQMADNPDHATIRLKFNSDAARLSQNVERRFNHESQIIDYPSDRGFEYVEQMNTWSGWWGKRNPTKKGKRNRGKDRRKKKAKKDRG